MNAKKHTKEKLVNVWNFILLHALVIGVFCLERAFKTEEEKSATSEAIRTRHNEDSRYLQMMQEEWENRLMEFENAPLHKGQTSCSRIRIDILSRKKVLEVGYGITPAEIAEAKRFGLLPSNAKLPYSLTKAQADRWFKTITFPTYIRCVEEVIGDRLITVEQKLALVSFTHNLGSANLSKLMKRQDDEIADAMKKYVFASGKPRAGLIKRRAWEAGWWECGMNKPAILASR